MGDERVLIVFFSDSGHTAQAARRLADRLPAVCEPLHARDLKGGLWGFAQRGFGALFGRRARLDTPTEDPDDYDIVIVAGPLWAGRLSTPIRAYLSAHGRSIGRAAFVVSHGGSSPDRALAEMRDLLGSDPLAELSISDQDRREGEEKVKIDRFALSLNGALDRIDEERDRVVRLPGRSAA